ncbi:MAG: precorrin-2 C(20)-methyltransferase, partial [Lachnospiraceae bacterium]|nr:precorrin-2 C(20)-methyltransferase [Lachnospiraceae bacterium]
MRGKAYGVGVGPGDPELMTLKAVRLIRESDVIAFPGKSAEESVAYRIARGAVPEIAEKTLVPVYMPMIRDREKIADLHRAGAGLLEEYLDRGQNVVYLTLGDSTVYCTFSYLQ